MNILKTLICAALLVAGLSGCEKIDVNKLEGTWSEQYDPTVDKGTITINPAMSDYSNVTYKLVKLTSKEMEWQKEGTTYSTGTWGSDYRHFVRGK